MIVTLNIPADLEKRLRIHDPDGMSHAALEALTLQALRQKKITEAELGEILGLTDRYARDGFLMERGVELDYTWEDVERERKAFATAGLSRLRCWSSPTPAP